jgi:hypothetical protein
MDIDYDLYADGEALLGWVNVTIRMDAAEPFDGNRFLRDVAGRVCARLATLNDGAEIAHFKMTLTPDQGRDLAVLNVVQSGGTLETPYQLAEDLTGGELILNLRAEGEPGALKDAALDGVTDAARVQAVRATVEHSEHFRPGRPQPTHRMAAP